MDPATRVQFVPIDGLLADVVTPYEVIATTLLQRIIEIPFLDPPHTLARLGVAAGLTPNQSARVIKAVCAIRDFWTRLEPLPKLETCRGQYDPLPIFYAIRPATVGMSVLMQTIDWFDWHGFKTPVVYVCEEDEFGDQRDQGQDGKISVPSLPGSGHHARGRRSVFRRRGE